MSRFRTGLVFLFLSVFSMPILATDFDYTVVLQQRKFKPDPIQKQGLAQKSSALLNKHIIMQFNQPLLDSDKDQLKRDGVELLEYMPNLAYIVHLTRPIDESFINQHQVRWFGEIYPDDKISPLITGYGIGEWARRDGGRVAFTVVLHQDEDINFWSKEFENKYDAQITGLAHWVNAIEMNVPEMDYLSISEQDEVSWIEEHTPPQMELNNIARINTGAEILQAAPFNLSGLGVVVAEWDGGAVDLNHPDLTGRVTVLDAVGFASHATHVAGTVLGTGAQSSGTYRGMAPQATLLSYLWWGSSSEIENDYSGAIESFGAVISTNSWGLGVGAPSEPACQSLMGNYFTECASLDDAVRGDGSRPPITICWAAGNERSSGSQYCGSIGWTYGTIGPFATAKNLITVGAIASSSSDMTSFSSWGPTDDGRIKPDVVGPGCTLTSCQVGGGYWSACGTSMATPATAGTIALMQDALIHSALTTTTVLPSTIKAILVNTAIDLGLGGFPDGPDYAFGFGKVNGVAACKKIIIGEPSYLENSITTGTVHLYDLTVPSGAAKLKVTLAWDDPGGTGMAGKTMKNDIDLVLLDPFSNVEQPWVLNPALPSDPATKGIDRTNNVETVEIDSPTPGLWKARVTGFNIPSGPQAYSLVFSPDSIYTPGNLSALAVFDQNDVTKNPGDSATVGFWVTNVGADPESVKVVINDDADWLRDTLVATVSLNPWDSAHYTVVADVPGGSQAGDLSHVTCRAVSQVDSNVTSQGTVNVVAGAYYAVALDPIANDTIPSPYQFNVQAILNNNGNAYDRVLVSIHDDLGWSISPTTVGPTVNPFGRDTVSFQVFVPAEVPHLQLNHFSVFALSDHGVGDTAAFVITVYNPLQPPQLLSPADPFYTKNRVIPFSWSGIGQSYKLVLASDTSINFPVRQYPGLTSQSFTMPSADSLPDGYYYWGVKQYVSPDSSSFQANTRLIVVDNDIPLTLAPQYPINGVYVPQKSFSFVFGTGKSGEKDSQSGLSPEYARLQLAKDAGFTNSLITYEPIAGSTFQIPDAIDEGRWYWRVERADSAGNHSGFSSAATFILDSQSPPIPTQLNPANGASVNTDSIIFKWSATPSQPYVTSGEFYRIQLSTSSQFLSLIKNQVVYVDSLKMASNTFTQNTAIYWRVKAQDSAGHASNYQASPFTFTYTVFICGDINGDHAGPNILDLTFLVDRIFRGGPPPNPFISGSVNCDSNVNILDLTYMVDRIFRGGPPPCCL